MSRHAHDNRVIDALTRPPADPAMIEPPADLAERIKDDVPATLELVPELAPELAETTGTTGRRRIWLAAASVVLTVGAGLVALQVRDRMEGEAVARGALDAQAAPASATRHEEATAGRPDLESAPVATESMALSETVRSRESASVGTGGETADAGQAAAGERTETLRKELPSPPSVAQQQVVDEARRRKLLTLKPSAPADEGAPRDSVDDEVTVTAKAPVLDERKISMGTTVSPEKDSNTFGVDGVQVNDMAAIGTSKDKLSALGSVGESKGETPSPTYYDFDQKEEVQVGSAPKARLVPPSDMPLSVPPPPPPARQLAPSTGGTAEPNDQPYGDVFFRGYGTNPFIDSEDDPLSTFGLDVDTGSWGVVRRYLRDGNLPPREAVRVEELVNAFDYGDPAPRHGDFRVVAEGAATPFAGRRDNPRYRVLRFGLHAREVDTSHRKPAVLTFVVDVSGSMGAENRLGLVRKALSLLLDQLRPDDRVGLVVYGSRGYVVLDHTSDLEAIRSAIGRLVPEGSTNAEEGLVIGYEAARRAFRPGAINRVILCSDGVANVGRTGPESILARIGDAARDGIELTTVGFGMGNYNDVLMEQLADKGDGMYAYVDDLDEARRVFVENLTGTLQTVARDAKAQVEVDPQVISRYRLLGYENRDVPDEKFRDDTVDAGEVGAGHTVTALYEVKLRDGIDPRRDRRRTAATLHLRWQSVASGKVEEIALPVTVGDLAGRWEAASPSLRLASVVAELAEALKGTYWARETDLDELFRRAQKVSADFPGRLDVAELVTTIGRAARLVDHDRQTPPGPGSEPE